MNSMMMLESREPGGVIPCRVTGKRCEGEKTMNFANMIVRETFRLTAFIVILSKISVQFILRKCMYPMKMMIREDGPISTPLKARYTRLSYSETSRSLYFMKIISKERFNQHTSGEINLNIMLQNFA